MPKYFPEITTVFDNTVCKKGLNSILIGVAIMPMAGMLRMLNETKRDQNFLGSWN